MHFHNTSLLDRIPRLQCTSPGVQFLYCPPPLNRQNYILKVISITDCPSSAFGFLFSFFSVEAGTGCGISYHLTTPA